MSSTNVVGATVDLHVYLSLLDVGHPLGPLTAPALPARAHQVQVALPAGGVPKGVRNMAHWSHVHSMSNFGIA